MCSVLLFVALVLTHCLECVLFDSLSRLCLFHCFICVLFDSLSRQCLHTVLYVFCLIICHVSVSLTVSYVLLFVALVLTHCLECVLFDSLLRLSLSLFCMYSV